MSWFKKVRADFIAPGGGLDRPYAWMIFACFIWLVAFGDYFTGQSRLSSDAISYFDHTIYFIENIKRGIFPLWDPTWNHGAPNDFFLRRIGCYNPIYLLMAILSTVGVTHTVAYLLVLSFYFFFGAFGFYLLTKTVYKDERVAFCAFLLLLFSTVGARIFDSYMCLIIVPTIWFFYFFTVFLLAPRRRYLAGLCLSFMIAMNTYIPLFFITIVFVVALFWLIFFSREAWEAGRRGKDFVIAQPVFSALLGAIVLLSLVPPVAFFLNTSGQGIVLPERHGSSSGAHVLMIDTKLLSWGVMEDLFFTGYFTDFRRFLLALVYVPLFGLLLWVWGACCRINRRILFYFSIGVFFILLGTPLAVPLHKFLYQHIFYFKYIRNLHFFLWFILLPLFIFVSAEFLAQILLMPLRSIKERTGALLIVIAGHLIFLLFTIWRADAVWTTFFVIGASFGISLWYLFVRDCLKGRVLWVLLLVVTLPQAIQVFHYIARNEPLEGSYGNVVLPGIAYRTGIIADAGSENKCANLYYGTSSFDDLCKNVSPLALTTSLTHRLVAYGRMEPMGKVPQDYAKLDFILSRDLDVGFALGLKEPLALSPREKPVRFEKDSSELSLAHFDANTLSLKTNFEQEKFLVYADSFAKGWQAFIDGRRVDLYAANLAYKGVRVPPGKRTLEFRYGNPLWYGFNWFMLIIFNLLFYGSVWFFLKNRREAIL